MPLRHRFALPKTVLALAGACAMLYVLETDGPESVNSSGITDRPAVWG